MKAGFIKIASYLNDNVQDEAQEGGKVFYITKLLDDCVCGFTDDDSKIKEYKHNLSFKNMLTVLAAQNFIKLAQIAEELGISRQLLNYKINGDKFNRKELCKIKELLHLSDKTFQKLLEAK